MTILSYRHVSSTWYQTPLGVSLGGLDCVKLRHGKMVVSLSTLQKIQDVDRAATVTAYIEC